MKYLLWIGVLGFTACNSTNEGHLEDYKDSTLILEDDEAGRMMIEPNGQINLAYALKDFGSDSIDIAPYIDRQYGKGNYFFSYGEDSINPEIILITDSIVNTIYIVKPGEYLKEFTYSKKIDAE